MASKSVSNFVISHQTSRSLSTFQTSRTDISSHVSATRRPITKMIFWLKLMCH